MKLNQLKTGCLSRRGPPAEQPSSGRARPRSARTRPAFVNSVCCAHRGRLPAQFTQERQILVEMCVCSVFSLMSWRWSGRKSLSTSNKRCGVNGCKGCKCALLEAHFAELQTKRRQAPVQIPFTTTPLHPSVFYLG